MKKEPFADKLSKKAFESATFQKSWYVHMQAFGPILEPAFAENYQVRVHLTAALNHISRRDIQRGLEKLTSIKEYCVTNEDKAAWYFFMGLAFDMAAEKEQMLEYYQKSAEFKHKFYLPYLKMAKSAHEDAIFEIAEYNYRLAIQCFDRIELDRRNRVILASIYTNLVSCLTMMHRYEEAREALQSSNRILAVQPGRIVSETILCAAMGEEENAFELLAEIEEQKPDIAQDTKKLVDDILNGTHPHFYPVEIDEDSIEVFWKWFVDNQNVLCEKLTEEKYDEVILLIQARLKVVFPFMERELKLGIQPKENGWQITFVDLYAVALEHGYATLIEACPEEVRERWELEERHSRRYNGKGEVCWYGAGGILNLF